MMLRQAGKLKASGLVMQIMIYLCRRQLSGRWLDSKQTTLTLRN
jgi:hypothetical protein